jgi:hypothetical protein
MVNTPMGRVNAEDPSVAAARILAAAASGARPGNIHYVK